MEKIEDIKQAISRGALTLHEIAEQTGLNSVYVSNSISEHFGPGEYSKLKEEHRISIINKIISAPSLEELCKITHLRPSGFSKFCKDFNIKLPSNLIPYRYRPEMDEVIDRGGTLQEIGVAGGYSGKSARENARRYIESSGQYEYWLSKRKDVKRASKIEVQQKKQACQLLGNVLEARVGQLAKKEGWAQQKAIEYQSSLKQIGSNSYSLEKLVKFFQRYEKAMNKGKLLSLEELGKPLGILRMGGSRIIWRVKLEPMYGKRDIHRIQKEKKSKIIKLARLGMTSQDIGYFLDLRYYTSYYFISRRGLKSNAKHHIFGKNSKVLNYRLASQIYEAHAVGFNRSEIAELLDTIPEIVTYAFNHKHEIAPRIVKALRIVYDSKTYNRTYKLGGKS